MAVCNLACEGLSSISATPDQTQRKLYIGSLSPDTTTEIEEGLVAYDKNTNKSRGYGFITYKTLEAAKKAIEDPQKTLGGRSITVKLADNNKSKVVVQTQVPAVVQMPIPLGARYRHPASADSSITPIGYTYPQLAGMYPITAFQSPQEAAAGSYPTHPVSYSLFPVKKESVAPSPTLPAGLSGYLYYFSKQ